MQNNKNNDLDNTVKNKCIMKKGLILASMGMLAISTITVVGCSKDEELDNFYNLDVEFRTPMTRSAQMDWEGGDPNKQRAYENKQYTSLPNCCGLTTMVEAWIKEKGSFYFEQEYCMTAQQYYDKLVNETKSNPDYHWTPDSASMPISTLMMLNEAFPVASKKNKDGSITNKNLFSGYKTFDNASEVDDYFDSRDNRNNVRGVLLQDENGNGHVAYVSSCSNNKINFTGYDIFTGNGYNGGSIGADGSSKNGWRVVGVILK